MVGTAKSPRMRDGATKIKNPETKIERMLSSKSRVKSKPPRHVLPAHGPNDLSGHDAATGCADIVCFQDK